MKKQYVFIILASTILGMLVGTIFRDYSNEETVYTSKDKSIRKEIRITRKSIKELAKEKDKLDKEITSMKKNQKNSDEISKIESLRESLSYSDVKGSGIALSIDAIDEKTGNIANSIDYNKILVKVINELKANGGKYIEINGQRVNQYSEVVLAGSHININGVPVAQPYEIKCIGDKDKLSSYIDKGSKYLDSVQSTYPMKISIKAEENISMKKLKIPNKLKYIKGD